MKTRSSWKVLAGAACVMALASACSGANTDDPASVASSVMDAVAKSDCKTVHKLFPTAAEDADYPAEGCTNEIDQSRAVGTYTCAAEGEQTASEAKYHCTSTEDPSTYFSVNLQKATDGWVVTGILGVPA